MDIEWFCHVVVDQLMSRVFHKTNGITMLELQKWMRGMDKAVLHNLLWVLHYNHVPMKMVVIKWLLCLVHDGCLSLEEPISITDRLIHRIMRLPYTGENIAMAFGRKTGEHVLMEAMEEKFKLANKPRSYTISSIYDSTVKVSAQIIAGKVMWKCRTNEGSKPVVALAAQCAEGVQLIGRATSMVSSSRTTMRHRILARCFIMHGSFYP